MPASSPCDCSKRTEQPERAINLLPASRDIAALPTSWALTLWDALPLYLSIEVALALTLVALTSGAARTRLWNMTRTYPVSAVLYSALFDARLTLLIAATVVGQSVYRFVRSPNGSELQTPDLPLQAIRQRGGAVTGDVAKAAGVAAIIKILISPELAADAYGWFAVAIIGGILAPGPIGVAAIPALSIASASENLFAPTIWLIVAVARPAVLRTISGWRRSRRPVASHLPPDS